MIRGLLFRTWLFVTDCASNDLFFLEICRSFAHYVLRQFRFLVFLAVQDWDYISKVLTNFFHSACPSHWRVFASFACFALRKIRCLEICWNFVFRTSLHKTCRFYSVSPKLRTRRTFVRFAHYVLHKFR